MFAAEEVLPESVLCLAAPAAPKPPTRSRLHRSQLFRSRPGARRRPSSHRLRLIGGRRRGWRSRPEPSRRSRSCFRAVEAAFGRPIASGLSATGPATRPAARRHSGRSSGSSTALGRCIGTTFFEGELIDRSRRASGGWVARAGRRRGAVCCARVSEHRQQKQQSDPSVALEHQGGIVEGLFGPEATRALPAALLGLLLVVSVWWDSAFDLRYWAPLTILALGLVLAQFLTASLSIPRRGPLAIATASIWCLAGFVLLTALGHRVPRRLGKRLLAASSTQRYGHFRSPPRRMTAGASASGPGSPRCLALAVATLIGLVADAGSLFLAGRLDAPVGYRNGTAALFDLGLGT